MASEDPMNMFADMKKKKKKPKVAFTEESTNTQADPAKEPGDDPSAGPSTVNEKVQSNENPAGIVEDGSEGANVFGDLKKKKKKKDLGADVEADATPAEGGDVLDFSDLKKKKKKKVVAESEDTPAPVEDGAPLEDFSDLKKKKKKKDILLNLEDGVATPPADDFSDLKKKKKKKGILMDLDNAVEEAGTEGGEEPKKKKKKKNIAMEEFEKEFGDGSDTSAAKPKKAKKVVEESEEEAGGEDGDAEFDEIDEVNEEELGENPFASSGGRTDADEPWLDSDRDYTYEELLSRFFRLLHAQNPSLASSSSKRYTLAPPSIHRDGNKKSVFANIGDICRRMHREPAHVISFLLVEMGTTGSVDGSGRLVIKGKFQQKQIENILRRYIVEYVTCKTCKSPDTLLTKETRISFITCESCGSRQSVSAIKAGFQAQVGKRKKQQV